MAVKPRKLLPIIAEAAAQGPQALQAAPDLLSDPASLAAVTSSCHIQRRCWWQQ